ncbi:MAG: hypothetical protein B1H12_03880 [Desulfobacteraceae bacterium 4484_190.2]|nr:MAG: hypothetical protein B1H12_03880 [Desulfobacteraceae bacterium 4484_190.2]
MILYMKFIMQKKFVKIDVFDTPNLLLTGQTFFPYAHNRFRRIKFLATLFVRERTSITCERACFPL